MKKRLIMIFLLTFFMFVGINKVSATTCEYEMYPTYYVYDALNSKFEPKRTYMGQENGKYVVENNAKLKYTIDETDKDNYTLEHIIMFDGTTNKTFKENSFNNNVWNNNKNSNGLHDCPKYVSVTKNSISEIVGASEFARQQQTFDSLESYPMVLVKQNSIEKDAYAKTAISNAFEDIDDYVNQITDPIKSACGSNYISLVTASNYGLDYLKFGTYVAGNERQTRDSKLTDECWRARKTYYSQISQLYNTTQEYANRLNESSVASKLFDELSQKTNGYTKLNTLYSKLEGTSKQLEQMEENNAKITKYSSSYCAGYCELIHCATSSGNSTAYEYCMRSCDENNNACTVAMDRCQNISDSTAQNACYEQNNFDNGSYSNARTQAIQDLENANRNLEEEINRIRTSIARSLDVDMQVYALKCEDVSMLHTIWIILWIAAPTLLVVLGTWDFALAVIAGDEEKMKKSKKRFPKRIIAFLVLALTPLLITLIVNLSTNSNLNDTSLMYCIVNGGD